MDDPLQQAAVIVDGTMQNVEAIHAAEPSVNHADSPSLVIESGSPTGTSGIQSSHQCIETEGISTAVTRAMAAAVNMREFARSAEMVYIDYINETLSQDAKRKMKLVSSVGETLTRALAQAAISTLRLQGSDVTEADRMLHTQLKAEFEWVVETIENADALDGDEDALKRFIGLGDAVLAAH